MYAQSTEVLSVESAIEMVETVIAETALDTEQDPTRYNYWLYQNYMIGEGIKAMGDGLGRPDFSSYKEQQLRYYLDAYQKINDRSKKSYLKPTGLWHSGMVASFVELQETSDHPEIARGISYYQNLLDTTHKVSDGSLARYKRQWDCIGIQIDDLYMISPYWVRLSRQLGKADYLEKAIEETLSYYKHLWNPETKLLHCLWLEEKPEVRTPHWGRGNGWFVMAITDLLNFVPDEHPQRAELLEVYNTVMSGIIARQNADGLWHQVLDHPESYSETSCSGMFTYSLLRGAAKGWLPASARDAGLKGWNGLQTKLTDNNQLEDVCVATGMSEKVNYYFHRPRVTHDQHGIGPYLLAASEIIKLTKKDRSEAEKPNIILIMADDLGYADLSCTGLADDVHTPNIDRIAKNGIRFTNAYVTAPICNASRIAVATGAYQQRQGQHWYQGPGLHDPKYVTIAETLKARGYKTGYVGKFHHGGNDAPNKRGFPLNHGYDTFYGFSGGTKHYLIHNRASEKKLYRAGPMYVEDELQDVEGFTTELFGQKGRDFVREHQDEAFHLFLSFNAVHHYINQLPEAYLKEKGLSRYPDFGETNEPKMKWREKFDYPNHPEGRQYYLGHLYYLDREIGLLLDQLETLGIADKTVVIFLGDNGGGLALHANNGPFKGGKYTCFEGGLHVPMLISHPGIHAPNTKSDAMVSSLDLHPTICAMTGSEVPANVDGINLSPLLNGEAVDLDDRVLYWDTNHQKAVRRGKWKLLNTKSNPSARLSKVKVPSGTFLFNLEEDPGERKDLSATQPEMVQELLAELTAWQEAVKQ